MPTGSFTKLGKKLLIVVADDPVFENPYLWIPFHEAGLGFEPVGDSVTKISNGPAKAPAANEADTNTNKVLN